MGRAKDNHPDAQHGNREGRRRKQGGKVFYKQPAGRGWGGGASSARPLDGRKGTNPEKHLERIINL